MIREYETEKLSDMPVIDCHTHISHTDGDFSGLITAMNESGARTFNALSLCSVGVGKSLLQNLLCLQIKASCRENEIYTFGSLHYPPPGEKADGHELAEQAKRLAGMGFEGFKMIEGKPGNRKLSGLPLDSGVYDEYYSFLESAGIPILYHVADPEEFWDFEKIPSWARSSGWFYDETYPTKEKLYGEVDGVLGKFPKLKTIFAHFYFKSASIESASEFLDKWPNANLDLTPGSEMYPAFSADPDGWREFFIKYQDRILYGTDSVDYDVRFSLDRNISVRNFLEKQGEFRSNAWECNLRGIYLDKEVLEKIYWKNFRALAGNKPKKIDFGLAGYECRYVMEKLASHPSGGSLLAEAGKICESLRSFML